MQRFERTTGCGQVSSEYIQKKIYLSGWVARRRDHGGLIFIDLRDRTGIMQLVFNADINQEAHAAAHNLRHEYVISVEGTVIERSSDTRNNTLQTGSLELPVEKLTIHSKAKTLPFHIDEAEHVDEELRLQYRYLDLRRPKMHNIFALRHNVIYAMRSFFHAEGFYEIETPILTKNTPEGAREFVVPSRIHKGSFYALPQSPQLYKQLLMASGMEKYVQIARCFRDEDLRADRQPEFTQLDIEMSFIQESDIQSVIERLIKKLWKAFFDIELSIPFIRMTYQEAFATYGTDKPDLRYKLPIYDCTSLFQNTELQFLRTILDKQGKIGALHIQNHLFSRSELDAWVPKAQQFGAKGLLWIRFKDGIVESPVAKFLPENFFEHARTIFDDLTPQSTLFLMAGSYHETWTLLGRLRNLMAQTLQLIPDNVCAFLWVVDFPLFEYDDQSKQLQAMHHPFTSPQAGWEDQNPLDIKARAYDIVLNGIELGGGSIRIHDQHIQEKVFTLLGLSKQQAEQKFGFLLEAQQLGFPPHGGIALGIDRLIMLMAQATSIREVIAFPKTARGFDPLMVSPTSIESEKMQEYGLAYISETKD